MPSALTHPKVVETKGGVRGYAFEGAALAKLLLGVGAAAPSGKAAPPSGGVAQETDGISDCSIRP